MDKGACQAAVHRVAKSWTQLKRLRMHTRIYDELWMSRGKDKEIDIDKIQ